MQAKAFQKHFEQQSQKSRVTLMLFLRPSNLGSQEIPPISKEMVFMERLKFAEWEVENSRSTRVMQHLYARNKQCRRDGNLFRSLAQKVVDRILEIELKRGDSETQVTSLAEELSYVYGAKTFIGILQAFGDDLTPDIVTGPCSSTEAGVAVIDKMTGLRALNMFNTDNAPRVAEFLRQVLPGVTAGR